VHIFLHASFDLCIGLVHWELCEGELLSYRTDGFSNKMFEYSEKTSLSFVKVDDLIITLLTYFTRRSHY